MKKRKGIIVGSGFALVFIIFAVIVTIFYNHRIEEGKYKFAHTLYVHDKGIAEYSDSAIVSFPIKGDYSDLINKEVYYYDASNSLKRDKLVSISLPNKVFVVNEGEFNTDKFLGKPSGGFNLFGSVLDFFTDKTVYIWGILIPGILCILYEIFAFVLSLLSEKKPAKSKK